MRKKINLRNDVGHLSYRLHIYQRGPTNLQREEKKIKNKYKRIFKQKKPQKRHEINNKRTRHGNGRGREREVEKKTTFHKYEQSKDE